MSPSWLCPGRARYGISFPVWTLETCPVSGNFVANNEGRRDVKYQVDYINNK